MYVPILKLESALGIGCDRAEVLDSVHPTQCLAPALSMSEASE
jgi:hypothetical protein